VWRHNQQKGSFQNVPRRSRGSATLPRQECSHADTSQRTTPRKGFERTRTPDITSSNQGKSAFDSLHNLLLGRQNQDIRGDPYLARPVVAYHGPSELST